MSFAVSVTQPAPACSEHALVAAVRRGDDGAFGELYSRYHGRIGTYIYGMVGDHARAEDIAQEVFISALRRLRDSERPIAFKPWIYEIAKNACIDEFRRTRRGREVPLASDDEGTLGERDLPSSAPGPDVAVESKQSLADLRGAFHGLSESHHKVIVMRELEGLSYSQIGERLGMSRPMVESTLFRARKRLSAEYGELMSGRRCQQVQMVIDSSDERALGKLGIRERRRVTRHLSHCQPCRRHARMAGVDDSVFHAPTLIGKIAALLPIPWLRWRRGDGEDDSVSGTGRQSFAARQSLQTVGRFADPAAPSIGVSRAAAAVAAVALAGVGGGVVAVATNHAGHSAGATPLRTHVTRPSSHRGAGVASASSRTIQRPSAARSASVGRPRRPPATGAASPRSSASATAPASAAPGSTAPKSTAPARAAASSTATGTSRQVNKVLSGATSAASGGAMHLGGVHLPGAPTIPARTLPKVPKVIELPKIGAPNVPKLKLPNPLSLLSSPPQLPQLPHLKSPTKPPVTVPQLPKVPNPLSH